MAEVTQLKRYDAPRINWGKWFLIGTGMLVSAFILLVPMVYIFVQAFSKGLMPVLQNLADPDMLHAIWLTVLIALIAVPVNLVFGVLLAWLVTRFNFPGRQLLLTLLDIPFAVSPVVAGLVYLLFYGSNGPLGGWLDEHNLQIMFAWPGMVLVTVFVTCPFVVRELVPVMLSQGSNEDEAAVLLGASGWQMFRRVTLPNIRWALLYGILLCNARAMGIECALIFACHGLTDPCSEPCLPRSVARRARICVRVVYWPTLPNPVLALAACRATRAACAPSCA